MTAGMSVTDIAASISLDYASFMQGMKSVEQRFVEFGATQAKAFEIALPDYQKQVQQNPLQFLQQRFGDITENNYKREAKVFADAIINDINSARAEAQRILDDMLASHQERGFLPDQGMAHVQAFIDEQIKADGRMTALIIANRQRVHQFDKEAHAYRIRAAKETADLEKRISDAKLLESQRVAEMHKYEQQQRKQEAEDRMEASNAIRRRMERDAELQSSISEIFSRQNQRLEDQAHKGDRIYALTKRQTQERKALLGVISEIVHQEKMLGNFNSDQARTLKQVTASFKVLQEQEKAAVIQEMQADTQRKTEQAANDRLATERKIEGVLNAQNARYDEAYAFQLRQKAARSEFVKLLREAKAQGVSNEDLTGAATSFAANQQKEKQGFIDAQTLKSLNAEKQARLEVLSILARQGNKQAEIRLLQVQQREEEKKFKENLDASNVSVATKAARLKELRAGHKKQMEDLLNPSTSVKSIVDQDAQEAERIINRLKTAQELHNERVATYARLLKTVNVETGRTYLTTKQYNEAVKESERVMRASAAGAGAYTGMLAQASFAAEDFVQGIAVGDLRSALLGASNNLTMVARGAFQAAEGVTILGMGIKTLTAYIIGIPAAIVGVVAAFSYLNRAEKDVRDLSTALRDLERGFELLQDKMNFRHQAARERQRISEIESLIQAQREYQNVLRQQKEAEEQLTAARARQSRMGSETLINTLGGQAAYAEMQDLISRLQESSREEAAKLGNEMAKAMSTAMAAAQAGEVEKMIDAMRLLNQLSNSAQLTHLGARDPGSLLYQLNLLLNDPQAQDSLEAIFNTGFWQQTEDQDALRKIRESMLETTREIAKAENELKQAGANKKQLEEQILKLKEDGRRLLGEEFEEKRRMAEQDRQQFAGQMKAEADMLEEKRKRAMFDMTATERQKELLRIQEQMREFMGPSAVLPFIPPGIIGADQIAQLMQQNAQNAGMQFLQGQAAQLEKEIKALQQSASPEVIGGMQQNAAAAQADAFKQIFAAANKQPNPQLARQIQLLQDIKAAIAQGGVIFQLVGQ